MTLTALGGIHIPELNSPFEFVDRPIDVPADLRPIWRIGLIVLLLKKCCRGSKGRFDQLHVLNWGVRTSENRALLVQSLTDQATRETLVVRIEPSLNKAVDFAIGEKLITRVGGDRLQLTPAGDQLAAQIESDVELFKVERKFMDDVGKKVSGNFVDDIFR